MNMETRRFVRRKWTFTIVGTTVVMAMLVFVAMISFRVGHAQSISVAKFQMIATDMGCIHGVDKYDLAQRSDRVESDYQGNEDMSVVEELALKGMADDDRKIFFRYFRKAMVVCYNRTKHQTETGG